MKHKFLLAFGIAMISGVLGAAVPAPNYECHFQNFPESLSKTFFYDGSKLDVRVELGNVNAQVYVNDGEIVHLRIGEQNDLPIPKFVYAIGYGLPPQMDVLYAGESNVFAALTCTLKPSETTKNETIPLTRQSEAKNQGLYNCPAGMHLCYTAWGKIPYCAKKCEN